MANIIRTAKSGSDWTSNKLVVYNITIVFQDSQTFFEEPVLPAPAVSQELLMAATYDDTVDDTNYTLLSQLDYEKRTISDMEESAVGDFALTLLQVLEYVKRGRSFRTCRGVRVLICM